MTSTTKRIIVGTAPSRKLPTCCIISCMFFRFDAARRSQGSRAGITRVEHLFVSGANAKVNLVADDLVGSCDSSHDQENFVQKRACIRSQQVYTNNTT